MSQKFSLFVILFIVYAAKVILFLKKQENYEFFFLDFLNRACWCFEIVKVSVDKIFFFRIQTDGFLHIFY